jgi:hypothetical protein
MTCPNCGHRVRDGAKFCEECGIVLPESTPAASSPRLTRPLTAPRRLEPTNVSAESANDDLTQDGRGQMSAPADNTGSRRIFVVVALGLVALLCFCCALAVASFAYLSQNPPSTLMPGLM